MGRSPVSLPPSPSVAQPASDSAGLHQPRPHAAPGHRPSADCARENLLIHCPRAAAPTARQEEYSHHEHELSGHPACLHSRAVCPARRLSGLHCRGGRAGLPAWRLLVLLSLLPAGRAVHHLRGGCRMAADHCLCSHISGCVSADGHSRPDFAEAAFPVLHGLAGQAGRSRFRPAERTCHLLPVAYCHQDLSGRRPLPALVRHHLLPPDLFRKFGI